MARDELSVQPWNSDNVNIRRRFREAIAENPFLNVLIQSDTMTVLQHFCKIYYSAG